MKNTTSASAEIFPSCRDRSKEADMATISSPVSYPDANVLDANLRKVINRGFRLPGNDHIWMRSTLRLFNASMRAFSHPATVEAFFEGQTMIEGEVLDIVIGVSRDGHVRTMTKEAYEQFVA